MKLTEENADYMDCRPDFDKDPINMDLVPEHMKEGILKRAAARAAKGQSHEHLDDPVRGK